MPPTPAAHRYARPTLVIRTITILPVKSLGAAKQRLSALLDRGAREVLAEAMFADVLAALDGVGGVEETAVVTGDSTAEAKAREAGVTVLRDRGEAGQSAAALIGICHALDGRLRPRAAGPRRHPHARRG